MGFGIGKEGTRSIPWTDFSAYTRFVAQVRASVNPSESVQKWFTMSKALIVGFQSNAQGINCITSIQVAGLFGMEHKNVLKKIATLIEEESLDRLQLEPISYPDSRNRTFCAQ